MRRTPLREAARVHSTPPKPVLWHGTAWHRLWHLWHLWHRRLGGVREQARRQCHRIRTHEWFLYIAHSGVWIWRWTSRQGEDGILNPSLDVCDTTCTYPARYQP